MPKYFTRDQAEHIVPKVEALMRDALRLKAQYAEAEQVLKTTVHEITMRGGMSVDKERMLEMQRRRDSAGPKLQAILESIQEHGCLVKDLDTGLLDFPTLYDGREVYLCWRLGESRIEFWHGVDEGFQGRKPIDEDFLARHSDG
ncbi:MAG TPA: DUF2203 domain-containing protein [Bryobacteraceae bacterium]|nr:DUF2203 domain-containing protein [Bryobacteraceae bacterium]